MKYELLPFLVTCTWLLLEDLGNFRSGSLILLFFKFGFDELADLVSDAVMLEHFQKVFNIELIIDSWFQYLK